MITLSVIKADIGGFVGHSESHLDVMSEANECLVKAQERRALLVAEPNESRNNFSAAQNHLTDAFTCKVRGMGPDVAMMEFEEGGGRTVSILMADKTSFGTSNRLIYRIFIKPFNTIRLVIAPKAKRFAPNASNG